MQAGQEAETDVPVQSSPCLDVDDTHVGGDNSTDAGTTAAAEEQRSQLEKPKSPLALALLHVKWASFLQKAGQHSRAVEHYDSALKLFPSPRAHFGRGTCLASLRRRREAEEALREALRLRPNYTAARVNLAGVLLAVRRFPEAEEQCNLALELEPGGREAVMNLANALRNLGRRAEALRVVWRHILAEEAQAEAVPPSASAEPEPQFPCEMLHPLCCDDWQPQRTGTAQVPLALVCVKWGSRYGADYVNRLHAAVRRQLPAASAEAAFICFTDDPAGLQPGVETRDLPCGLSLWWGKAFLFSEEAGLDGYRVLYLDLDQVICGSLERLLSYKGPFALLATDGIACELAGGGYNSSVMAWEASPFFRPVHARLSAAALKYVHRFDHWLEMMIQGADLWQEVAPGQIVDYTQFFLGGVCVGSGEECCTEGSFAEPAVGQEGAGLQLPGDIAVRDDDPPSGAAIVTFPRSPKPHEVMEKHAWIRQHWL